MKTPRITAQSRESLDARFKAMRPTTDFKPPVRGWIKAIREALGMSAVQLARRMHIKQPSVVALEQSEIKGTIQLATLRRAAEAMNCTLVYALIPNDSLEAIVQKQAHRVARRRLQSVEHSMSLEDQGVPEQNFEKRIDALALDLNPRALWDDP
jgi:predicted DNA-binding mobile mystery protein A